MTFIIGLVITLLLTVISSFPVFIFLKYKNAYSNKSAWLLYFLCFSIYIILKALCVEEGILEDGNVPMIAFLLLWFISRIGCSNNNEENTDVLSSEIEESSEDKEPKKANKIVLSEFYLNLKELLLKVDWYKIISISLLVLILFELVEINKSLIQTYDLQKYWMQNSYRIKREIHI